MKKIISDILPFVQTPSRYSGGEINVYHKHDPKVSFALSYPDLYEIGMSSLGVRIIYGLLNEIDEVGCERVFSPGSDMEEILKTKKIPLFSLESKKPVKNFDFLGFSISSELNYTNILNILSLSDIPILSKDRCKDSPIIVAGGNSVYNFSPLTPFIDIFIVGEGEEVLPELIETFKEYQGLEREKIIEKISHIQGIYSPLYTSGKIKKRFVKNFDESFFPTKWLIPLTEIVHDRISLEIMRGCGQGCFFCQAGSCWKPVRARSVEKIVEIAEQTYKNTGYDEFSLLSFSSGDHPKIENIVDGLLTLFREKRVTISFPSVRIDTFSFELASKLKEIKKTGLTFAPETSERLRFDIGKKIKDEELLKMVKKAKSNGWRQIKLYFMLGLPGEEEKDILDIARLINELSRTITIKAAFNTFVPKPHSIFERERFISQEEYDTRKKLLVEKVRNSRFTKLTFHPYQMSCVEGLLGRGDELLSDIILDVWQKGAKMENWGEYFNFSLWQNSFTNKDLSFSTYLDEMKQATLPWDLIEV